MTVTPLILLIASFAFVALLVLPARKVAMRVGLVDRPGGRKKHEGAVPVIGGLVVFPVFMALTAVSGIDWSVYWAYFAALVLMLGLGVLDDRSAVSAKIKFGVQFVAAALIVVPGQAQVIMLGDLFGFGRFGLNFLSIPFSMVAVVLLINAVNLMDGLDGLAGGKGFIIMAWLVAACLAQGASGAMLPPLILMGALGGFLLYNMRHPLQARASVFLGDSGSLALGLSLAWFAIWLAKGESPVVQPISVAWLLALPIYDTCGQFARRVSQGRHPFDADHDHFHHHFIYAGFPVGQATLILLSITFVCGLIGIGGMWIGLPEAALTYPWIALLFVHIYMSMRPHRFRRLVARLRRGGRNG